MSWSGTVSGDYHRVVQQVRDFDPETDSLAKEYGHVQIAKDAALTIIDSKKNLDAIFSISMHGHSSTRDSFGVGLNVAVTQNKPEAGE